MPIHQATNLELKKLQIVLVYFIYLFIYLFIIKDIYYY